MTISFTHKIDHPEAEIWLEKLGFQNPTTALANFKQIIACVSDQDVELLLRQVIEELPSLSDPDRMINNLERFVSGGDFQKTISSEEAFQGILTLFSTSQSVSDQIIQFPDYFAAAEKAQGKPFTFEELTQKLSARLNPEKSSAEVMAEIRRFKHLETTRIIFNDLALGQRLEPIAQQISLLAAAVIQATYQWSRDHLAKIFGEPLSSNGTPVPFVVLAFGKLGGLELNYSSDIDLVMVFEEHGETAGGNEVGASKISNEEFFSRLSRDIVKLIGENTDLGIGYRVDLRLRPNGSSGKICNSVPRVLQYYDLQGRTWERQALVKATPIAGEKELGKRLLESLTPWIYRRNLSRADISGIKALKRKIERRSSQTGESKTNIKTGHGGIRDIEFVIQFMQLLNGGELPEVRTTNTLDAIRRLSKVQCLSNAESTVLSQNYEWLRKLEHRLQMMFDLQTHTLPADEIKLASIARGLGFAAAQTKILDEAKRINDDTSNQAIVARFNAALTEVTESNRKILDHLLHNAFGMAFGSLRDTTGSPYQFDLGTVPLEVDLILDPDPSEELRDVLKKYGFQDTAAAHRNLMDLASEPTQFLSSRRCKHFLASVAPALLTELANTPNPDASLITLATVSDCLGAKGVLWELFSFNPPTLSLYVRLCASSDYLVGILRSNPGMIDELVDALQLQGLPSRNWLDENLQELIGGAQDLAPIIHSFKNTQHTRVGIRDILGRDDVQATHQALSDVAEICLNAVAQREYEKMIHKHVMPDRVQEALQLENPFVILGLGKLGGREPNYHSDLDLVFLYDSGDRSRKEFDSLLKPEMDSQFFFGQLAAEITQFIAHSQSHGRLYEIDCRLRPTGKSGPLAVSMDEFKRYFDKGQGQLWERQSLCKARPVFGSTANRIKALELVYYAVTHVENPEMICQEIRSMRMAMQKDCASENLKRGEGGTVDVEFTIQMLQLKHAKDEPSVLIPGTLKAIERLVELALLSESHGRVLSEGYQLLRSVEARLRLMNTTARHDLPTDSQQLSKLAYLLNYESPDQMVDLVLQARKEIRGVFDELVNSN
jgi:glutamate-ammonia-ligase adenylyltransferase